MYKLLRKKVPTVQADLDPDSPKSWRARLLGRRGTIKNMSSIGMVKAGFQAMREQRSAKDIASLAAVSRACVRVCVCAVASWLRAVNENKSTDIASLAAVSCASVLACMCVHSCLRACVHACACMYLRARDWVQRRDRD